MLLPGFNHLFPHTDQQTEATVSGEIPEIDELVLEWTTLRKDEINI